MVKKSNLFIVGTHKAGTSALRYILKQHPDIYFPNRIEMHHFESDLQKQKLAEKKIITEAFLKKNLINRSDYLSYYNVPKEYKVLGDKTPAYLISQTSASEIYEFNKNAKIIATFRDPVEYIYSLHSQNLYNLYENITDFEEALSAENERGLGAKMSKKGRMHKHLLMYRKRVNYKEQLERFVRIFPKKNIKCIIFEDFKKSNHKTVNEIEDFLGLTNFSQYNYHKINTNKERRFVSLKKMIGNISNLGINNLLLTANLNKKLGNAFNNLTTVKKKRKEMDIFLYKSLKKEFKPIVEDFSSYMADNDLLDSKDLIEKWGYQKF